MYPIINTVPLIIHVDIKNVGAYAIDFVKMLNNRQVSASPYVPYSLIAQVFLETHVRTEVRRLKGAHVRSRQIRHCGLRFY